MIKINNEKCIKCFACLSTCEKGVVYAKGIDVFIDEKKAKKMCKDCDKHCILFCPTAAITD
jgi:MinD superfamily P-loop ATPase